MPGSLASPLPSCRAASDDGMSEGSPRAIDSPRAHERHEQELAVGIVQSYRQLRRRVTSSDLCDVTCYENDEDGSWEFYQGDQLGRPKYERKLWVSHRCVHNRLLPTNACFLAAPQGLHIYYMT